MTAGPDDCSWLVALHRGQQQDTPIGTGIVVDSNLVLTCHHVAFGNDGKLHDDLWISFPRDEKVTWFDRRQIGNCLHDGMPGAKVDLVMLELVTPVPASVTPARLRCLPPKPLFGSPYWTYGYPTHVDGGCHAEGSVGQPGGYGRVMIHTASGTQLSKGFSGGPVWSPDYQAVVGIVVSTNNQDDGQAVTLHYADLHLPEMKLATLATWRAADADDTALAAWGWALATDGEAGRHWLPRARGVAVDTEGGARFRGRAAALRRIVDWIDNAEPISRPLIVTGSPGVGKSAVLGRVVTTADPQISAELAETDVAVRAPVGAVSCAVHVKGKTALEVAAEIARAIAVELPAVPADLMPAVRDQLDHRRARFTLVVDALDEATDPAQARMVIDDVLMPLARDCGPRGLRIVIGTRRSDDHGDLISRFGGDAELVDLDAPEYFAESDLADYAQATLQLIGAERPGNPYADPPVAAPLARRIAALAKGNFLVAGLIARAHALRDNTAIDPDEVSFTATVAHALDTYLAGLPTAGRTSARLALTALAYAETPGLPLPLWQAAIEALGGSVTEPELAVFARTSAANFLVETGGGARPVYRLFHQALNDALLADRDAQASRRDDHARLLASWTAVARATGWAEAPDYLLRSLPQHAARAGAVDDLLTDNDYLLHAHLDRLLTVADAAETPLAVTRALLLQRTPLAVAAEPAERAALFSVVDRLNGLDNGITAAAAPYRASWAHTPPRQERSILDGHSQAVYDVAAIVIDGRRLLASVGDDGTVRLWDPLTNQAEQTFTGHDDTIHGVCAARLATGEVLLATASHDGTIGLWDPRAGHRRHELRGHGDWVRNICAIPLPGGDLLASAGDDRTVRLWHPATGTQGHVLHGHTGWVTAVTHVPVGDRQLLASTGYDGTVRLWDPVTGGEPVGILTGHVGWVNTLYAVRTPGRTLLASAGYDGTVRIWDPLAGVCVQAMQTGGPLTDLCTIETSDGCLLVSTGEDGLIRLWEVPTGNPQQPWIPRPSLRGHASWIRAVCELPTAKKRVLATAGDDGTVRLWDPGGGPPGAVAEHDRIGAVTAVCPVPGDEGRLVASAGLDGQVRIWEAVTGAQLRQLRASDGPVNALSVVADEEEARILTAGDDRTIRLWDARNGASQGEMNGHYERVAALCPVQHDTELLVASGGEDMTVRLWHPYSAGVRLVLLGHVTRDWVTTLATVAGPDGELLASADKSGTIMLWDAGGTALWSQQGHQDAVNALCGLLIAGRPALASASADHTIRLWDAEYGQPIHWLNGHTGPVTGLCLVRAGGRDLLASTSHDRTVRIWDPLTGRAVRTIPVLHPALACCTVDDTLLIGLDQGLLALTITS